MPRALCHMCLLLRVSSNVNSGDGVFGFTQSKSKRRFKKQCHCHIAHAKYISRLVHRHIFTTISKSFTQTIQSLEHTVYKSNDILKIYYFKIRIFCQVFIILIFYLIFGISDKQRYIIFVITNCMAVSQDYVG